MIMNCGRCGKEIDTPNKRNAKYIMNPNDERTFGKTVKNKFVVIDEDIAERKEFNDFQSALTENQSKVASIIKTQKQKQGLRIEADEDYQRLEKDFEVLIEGKDKENKKTEYEQRNNDKLNYDKEIEDLDKRKIKIRIVEEVKEEDVPKTLIVCPECVIEGDQIIW